VLAELGPVIKATPLLLSSQASWNPKTPKTLPEIKKQVHLVLTENRKRRRSSASLGDKPFQQLLKGFEIAVHKKALLMAKVAVLRAENKHQKQKRARQKGYIRNSESMTVQDGQESVQRRVVDKQIANNVENIDPALLTERQRGARAKAPPRCSRCNSYEHNARTCSL
jgi:hypothetical protein